MYYKLLMLGTRLSVTFFDGKQEIISGGNEQLHYSLEERVWIYLQLCLCI
jgi:hypothetical protein